MEKKKLPFSSAPKDDRSLPDVHLSLYNNIIVFDHVEKVNLLFLYLSHVSFNNYEKYTLAILAYEPFTVMILVFLLSNHL